MVSGWLLNVDESYVLLMAEYVRLTARLKFHVSGKNLASSLGERYNCSYSRYISITDIRGNIILNKNVIQMLFLVT